MSARPRNQRTPDGFWSTQWKPKVSTPGRAGTLSCLPQQASALFDPSDPSWAAADVLQAMQSVRSRLRVPFYIYDGDAVASNFSVAAEVSKVEQCIEEHSERNQKQTRSQEHTSNRWKVHGYNMAEFMFLKALDSHPWRVSRAAAADILVVPGFAGFETEVYHSCQRLVRSWVIASAVKQSHTWLTRSRDHLVVSDVWYSNWYPSWARATGMAARTVVGNLTHDFHGSSAARAPPSEVNLYLTRAWLETHQAKPLLGKGSTYHLAETYVGRQEQLNATDMMIAMPQADSQVLAVPQEETQVKSVGVEDASRTRRLNFFFGGQTTAHVGPGRRHLGYYVRWALMRSWAASPGSFPRTLLIETDGPVNVSRFGQAPWPALRRCDHGPGWMTRGWNTGSPVYRQITPHDDGSAFGEKERDHLQAWVPSNPRSLGRECLSPCTKQALLGTGAACYTNSFAAEEVMPHVRFALCPRGDISMSFRTYDAIRHGAIPVFIADHIWQVGLPFQCFVPWELMSFTLPENEILSSNFAEALRDILAKLTPASERRMRELLAHFARDLLWRTDARRVSENILLEALRARTRPPASGEACCPFRDRTDWPYA